MFEVYRQPLALHCSLPGIKPVGSAAAPSKALVDDTGPSGRFDITRRGRYHDDGALITALPEQLSLELTLF
jgi:hypothetical protein